MAPLLRMAYLDETALWEKSIQRAAGRIAGVYVYDKHWLVHCGEWAPSYELSLLGYLTELSVTNRVHMAMTEAVEIGSVTYVHVADIERLPKRRWNPDAGIFSPFQISCVACTSNLPLTFRGDHARAIGEALCFLRVVGLTSI